MSCHGENSRQRGRGRSWVWAGRRPEVERSRTGHPREESARGPWCVLRGRCLRALPPARRWGDGPRPGEEPRKGSQTRWKTHRSRAWRGGAGRPRLGRGGNRCAPSRLERTQLRPRVQAQSFAGLHGPAPGEARFPAAGPRPIRGRRHYRKQENVAPGQPPQNRPTRSHERTSGRAQTILHGCQAETRKIKQKRHRLKFWT